MKKKKHFLHAGQLQVRTWVTFQMQVIVIEGGRDKMRPLVNTQSPHDWGESIINRVPATAHRTLHKTFSTAARITNGLLAQFNVRWKCLCHQEDENESSIQAEPKKKKGDIKTIAIHQGRALSCRKYQRKNVVKVGVDINEFGIPIHYVAPRTRPHRLFRRWSASKQKKEPDDWTS